MQTWFENTIHKRPLYSGSAYVFTVRTDCISGTIEYAVYNPLSGPNRRLFTDFTEAKNYYLSLGNKGKFLEDIFLTNDERMQIIKSKEDYSNITVLHNCLDIPLEDADIEKE